MRQAALAGTLNLPMRYDDLSALSPVVRKEVLTGELSRRLKTMDGIPAKEIDSIVEALVGLSLSEVISVIQEPTKLHDQVQHIRGTRKSSKPATPAITPPVKTPSPANSQDSRLLDPNALNATASAPEHPSTPISVSASLSTPPQALKVSVRHYAEAVEAKEPSENWTVALYASPQAPALSSQPNRSRRSKARPAMCPAKLVSLA